MITILDPHRRTMRSLVTILDPHRRTMRSLVTILRIREGMITILDPHRRTMRSLVTFHGLFLLENVSGSISTKDQCISSYILEQLLDFSEYQEKNIISCEISNYIIILHDII